VLDKLFFVCGGGGTEFTLKPKKTNQRGPARQAKRFGELTAEKTTQRRVRGGKTLPGCPTTTKEKRGASFRWIDIPAFYLDPSTNFPLWGGFCPRGGKKPLAG